MFPSPWLRNVLAVAHSRKDRRRLAAQNRKTIRLQLESLEERLTPSAPTQTAGSYTDLVNAIAADTAANTNYVIQITQSFQFSSGGQVSISKLGSGSTLTIEGQNGTNYTLTGNGNRLFTIASGQNVTFEDLTLTGGTVTSANGNAQGGAILDQGGNVTLSKMTVKGNSVTGYYAEGGGIYVSGGGNLTIQGSSTIESNSAQGGTGIGSFAEGGGLFVNSLYNASNLVINDSTFSTNKAQGGQGANGATPGAAGGNGSEADGGGVFVTGNGWNATFKGDTFLGNAAIGGNGGNGAAGSAATAANTSGGSGGNGGAGGSGIGGAAEFLVTAPGGGGTGTLTILNDTANPSTMIGNVVQSGSAGNGGNGGTSTGTANNSDGGAGGFPANAFGGALNIESDLHATVTVNIGNTTFYGNAVFGGNGGTGGAAGMGGSGAVGKAGNNMFADTAYGGAIALEPAGGSVTMANCTVAKNTDTAGFNGGGTTYGSGALGGGILDNSPATVILDNNTITQNTITGSSNTLGAGVYVLDGNPTLFNNLIQGNQSIGGSALDLEVNPLDTTPLSNATNNFITTISPNAVSSSSNIIGNSQNQLGSVAGVDSKGNPTGGPIYYPLLSGVVSIGAGTTSDLSTIASVEGTTSANATDEIGNPRSSNNSIDLGAVQYQNQSPSAPTVSTNPSNQTVTAGGNVSFTVASSGNPTAAVQWQVSTDGGKTFSNISGATSTTLTLNNVQASQNGDEYQAIFANNFGSATTTAALLNVQFAPTVTTNPSNQIVAPGGTATFTAAAGGNPMPTVQWQVSSDAGAHWSTLGDGNGISGSTSNTLTLSNVTTAMSGEEFQAVFKNNIGTITSTAATLTMQAAPAITSGNSAVFTVGQSGSFTVTATGAPTPTLTEQGALPSGVTFTDNGNGTATLAGAPAAGTNGSYSFFITAHNGAGSDFVQDFTLTVNAATASPPPASSPSTSSTSSTSSSSSSPPVLKAPVMLSFFDLLFGGIVTDNANGTETVTDSMFGIPFLVSIYDGSGNLMSVTLFGFNITSLFV